MSLFSPDARRQLVLAVRVGSLGIEFAVAVCIGYFGGAWLDRTVHTVPWLSYAGALLGAVAGVVRMIRVVRSAGLLDDSSDNAQ